MTQRARVHRHMLHGMRPSEIQARALIAAALITSGTVVVPPIPTTGNVSPGPEARRLRALTDHLYMVLTRRSAAPGSSRTIGSGRSNGKDAGRESHHAD